MSGSIRILSYNTQLRSWAMQVGASPGYTIPPVDTSEERATLIADAIVNSPRDYDIVGLCEVFDEDAREILRDRMRGQFPFQLTKADSGYVRYQTPTEPDGYLALLAAYKLVGQPYDVDSGYRLEDSGLMLFSRWPFDTVSTAGLSPLDLLTCMQLYAPVGPTIPTVNFFPYTDTAGHDGDACKGVLYMRVKRDAFTPPYHVFFSHTQADDDRVEEHREARSRQLRVVGDFMAACAGGLPFPEETFFMGDLNVRGEQDSIADHDAEWYKSFDRAGRVLADHAVDLWGRRQCVGAPGLRDPGYSATVRYPPQEQRLDYLFAAASSGLAAQHVMIDYDVADVPPGHPEVSYLSDHRPLASDFASPRPNSTPADPHVAQFPVPPAVPLFRDEDQHLAEGQVKWYRFDAPGTYDFRLRYGGDECEYQVYLDTDMSRPRKQYRKETTELGDKYVLASAPFLVKVSPFSRTGELTFGFQAYKHQGTGPWDAIQIPYGMTIAESFPLAGQALNNDFGSTPWDDSDTKWFRIDGPQIPMTRDLQVMLSIDTHGVSSGVSIVRSDAAGAFNLEHQEFGLPHYQLDVPLREHDVVYVQVHRRDGMNPGPLDVILTATTDVSILLGGKRGAPRLLCQDETSGWGADDIVLEIFVDGVLLRHISNDEIGDFEQDDVRDLNQWIPDLQPYFDGVTFKVIEMDDTSPDDIGQETLKRRSELDGWNRFAVTKSDDDRTVRGAMAINVDDGMYNAQVSVTTWDEQF
jgi:hypothetical protein